MSSPSLRAVTRRAHAKINVFLRVLGRRADGLHDLESLVLPISLHDVVMACETEPPGEVAVLIAGEHDLTRDVEEDPRTNLAGRAALALAERVDRPAGGLGIELRLDKRIPVAAGLGGGSADAAATLLALDELWGCNLDDAELRAVGAELGSDVPAMLAGGPTLATGRGERLTPVHAATTWWVLKPAGFPVSAGAGYAWWDEAPLTGPDPGALIAALETGDLELLGDALFNDLQPAVVGRYPEIDETIEAFLDAGALGAIMSGSGPTVAALARHIGHAEALAAAVPGSIVVSAPPGPAAGAGRP